MQFFNYNKRTMRVTRKRTKIEQFFGMIESAVSVSRIFFRMARKAFPTAFKVRAKYNKITFKNWR